MVLRGYCTLNRIRIVCLLADIVLSYVVRGLEGVQDVLANCTLALIMQNLDVRLTVLVFLVLVEADHLIDDRLCYLIQRSQ